MQCLIYFKNHTRPIITSKYIPYMLGNQPRFSWPSGNLHPRYPVQWSSPRPKDDNNLGMDMISHCCVSFSGCICHVWHAWQTIRNLASPLTIPQTCSDTPRFFRSNNWNLYPLLDGEWSKNHGPGCISYPNALGAFKCTLGMSDCYKELYGA